MKKLQIQATTGFLELFTSSKKPFTVKFFTNIYYYDFNTFFNKMNWNNHNFTKFSQNMGSFLLQKMRHSAGLSARRQSTIPLRFCVLFVAIDHTSTHMYCKVSIVTQKTHKILPKRSFQQREVLGLCH